MPTPTENLLWEQHEKAQTERGEASFSAAPLPQEVKDIMKLAARYEYDLLAKAGWCKNCKREKTDGSRLCPDCKELARVAAEKVNRRNGHKSWETKRAEKSANADISDGGGK